MPYRILIADDEAMERRALRMLLGAEGMPDLEILEAANGLEAIEIVGAGRLDLAFLDIRMPGLDGIETASRFRERMPSLPIIFLTAHDSFDYARSALRLRVEDFLLKPASSDEVHSALLRALGEGGRSRAGGADELPDAKTRFEGALAYVSDELRASLASGSTPADKIARYLGLRGREWKIEGLIALRAELALRSTAPECRGKLPQGGAEIQGLAQMAERIFGNDSRLLLAGSGSQFVLCLAASLSREGDKEAHYRELLVELAERARSELCLRSFAGAALTAAGSTAEEAASPEELAHAARRAATLAGAARPIIILSLSSSGRLRFETEGEGRTAGRETVRRALEVLEERHAEELSLDALASELGVSASHLSRLLGRHAGMGFADCLASFRVERAKGYLSSSTLSVKEASILVGFRDPAYFARVFRRLTGESPAEYRAAHSGRHVGEEAREARP